MPVSTIPSPLAASAYARLVRALASGLVLALGLSTAFATVPEPLALSESPTGVVFHCAPAELPRIEAQALDYLTQLGVSSDWVERRLDVAAGSFSLTLKPAMAGGDTLGLINQVELGITEEPVALPTLSGNARFVLTVSKKEILLALLHPGRVTLFQGKACSIEALRDHVGLRQNLVAWAESLEWGWPEGGPARWNPLFWRSGNLVKGRSLSEAVNDIFLNQSKYAIGCYTATKLVILQGTLDYFQRVKKNPAILKLVHDRLLEDADPLVGTEPGEMWGFEADSTATSVLRPGKLMQLQRNIAPKNFIPGDWSYFLNTDSITYEKTGYEGSNAVYLGRGKFDDYYNDHGHSYTYKEKLNEVFQWRNRVFSSSRDVAKVRPLSAADYERLGLPPTQGGLVMGYRAVPFMFGFEDLPPLP